MFFCLQQEGQIILEKYKNFRPLGCEPLSPLINNVSGSIEESLILHPGASYKEKFRCRSQERGAEVCRFSRTGMDLRNGLLTKIGCFLKRRVLVSAGPGSGSASHSSRILSKDYLLLSFPSSTLSDISTSLLQGDLSRNSKACHIENRVLSRGLSSFSLAEITNLSLEPWELIPPPAMLSLLSTSRQSARASYTTTAHILYRGREGKNYFL